MLLEDVLVGFVYLLAALLHVLFDSCLMKSLVERGVLSVDKDLAVFEPETLCRLLVEYDIQRDLLRVLRGEVGVLCQFLPRGSLSWILLHSLAEEFEAR